MPNPILENIETRYLREYLGQLPMGPGNAAVGTDLTAVAGLLNEATLVPVIEATVADVIEPLTEQVVKDQFDTQFLTTAAIEATAGIDGQRAFDSQLGVFRDFDGTTFGGSIGGRFSKEVPLWNTSVRLGVETDNSDKINEIIGNLSASGGGIVHLPTSIDDAVYLGDTLLVGNGVGIKGTPRNSLFRMIAGCNKTAIKSSQFPAWEAWKAGGSVGPEPQSNYDISFQHLFIDGNYEENTLGGGIWLHSEGIIADDIGMFGTAEEGWRVEGTNIISSLEPKSSGREEGLVTRLITRRCGHVTNKDAVSHKGRADWRYDNVISSIAGRHGFYNNASIEIGFLHGYACEDVCVFFDINSNVRAVHIAARDGKKGNFEFSGSGLNNWIGLLYTNNGGRDDPTKPSIIIDTGGINIGTIVCATPNFEEGVVIQETGGQGSKGGSVSIGSINIDGRGGTRTRTLLHVNRIFTVIGEARLKSAGVNSTALKTENSAATRVKALITGTTGTAWNKVDTNGNANEWDITISAAGITTPKTGASIGPNETVDFKHQTGANPFGSKFKGVTADVAVDAVASVDITAVWNLIQTPTAADLVFSATLRASGVQVTDAIYDVTLKTISAAGATFTVKTLTASATAGAKIAVSYRVQLGR